MNNQKENKGNIFLIDFMSFFFRAYWVYKNDVSTNLIELIEKMIWKQIVTFKIENLIICDDPESDGSSIRKKIFSAYKENREEKDDELKVILKTVRDYFKEKYCYVSCEGYECDDVLGTLAKYLYGKNFNTIIFTSDKDLQQLVNDKVFIIDTRKKDEKTNKDYTVYSVNKIYEKYGFYPDSIIDFYSLLGDSIDNIPGVKGIGEKTAKKLIKEYKSLDKIYQDVNNLKGAVKKKLIDGRDNAYLSKKLFTLIDVPGIIEKVQKEKIKVKK